MQQNPFENPLVITKILSYIDDLKRLKILRMLNRQWQQFATERLSLVSFINIDSKLKIERYIKVMSLTNVNQSSELQDRCTLLRIRNVQINRCDLTKGLEKQLFLIIRDMQPFEIQFTECDFLNAKHLLNCLVDFANLCSGSLHSVYFNDISLYKSSCGEDNEIKNISVIRPLESVRKLEIVDSGPLGSSAHHYNWEEILQLMPNLSSLHVQTMSDSQITRLLLTLKNRTTETRIEDWSTFLTNIPPKYLSTLSSLKLRKLDISFVVESSEYVVMLENFLSGICSTLSVLKIVVEIIATEFDEFEFSESLSTFKELRSLEWLGCALPLRLWTRCSNLVSLNCSEINGSQLVQLITQKRDSSFSLPKLRYLSVEHEILSDKALAEIGKKFNNIKYLCAFLDNCTIKSVYNNFPKLEELQILGTDIDDDGLVASNQDYGSPTLLSLTRLRKLTFYPQPLEGVTDRTVTDGLVHLKELTWLELPETAVSDKALELLKASNPNLVHLSARVFIDTARRKYSLRLPTRQIL